MPNLEASFRALRVLHTAKDLFMEYGFHKVGVDRIIAESKVNKATFYKHFHSKERFIEMCLTFQKDGLQDQVISMLEYDHSTSLVDKLKALYDVHTDLEGLYYLLFKAIFETKNTYSNAYQVALKYRTWITNEIYSQLSVLKADASFHDAKLLLHIIEGTIIQRLSHIDVDERDKQFEYFIMMFL